MSRIEELIKEKCPNGVKKYTIAELCKSLKKSTLKMSELLEDGYPVINSGRNLYGFYSDYNNEGPAFTVAARGEYAAFVNYFADRFWAGGLCYPYTSKDETFALTKFIYYSLKNDEREIRNKIVADGSIPALNKYDLEKIKIAIPPIEVQEEIVRILDKFSELEAELEAELEVRKKQYEFWGHRFFECNEYKKLFEVAEIKTGSSNTNQALKEGLYPFYTRSQEVYYLNEYEFDDESIITAGDGAGVGKSIHYVNGKYALHQRAYRICPNKDILLPKYLYYYMKSSFYDYIINTAVSSSVTSIRKKMLDEYIIPLPSIEHQTKIVNILDKFDKLINDISEGIPVEIEARRKQYEYYRNKLLSFEVMK